MDLMIKVAIAIANRCITVLLFGANTTFGCNCQYAVSSRGIILF